MLSDVRRFGWKGVDCNIQCNGGANNSCMNLPIIFLHGTDLLAISNRAPDILLSCASFVHGTNILAQLHGLSNPFSSFSLPFCTWSLWLNIESAGSGRGTFDTSNKRGDRITCANYMTRAADTGIDYNKGQCVGLKVPTALPEHKVCCHQ